MKTQMTKEIKLISQLIKMYNDFYNTSDIKLKYELLSNGDIKVRETNVKHNCLHRSNDIDKIVNGFPCISYYISSDEIGMYYYIMKSGKS